MPSLPPSASGSGRSVSAASSSRASSSDSSGAAALRVQLGKTGHPKAKELSQLSPGESAALMPRVIADLKQRLPRVSISARPRSFKALKTELRAAVSARPWAKV
jgi:hypothetical protein